MQAYETPSPMAFVAFAIDARDLVAPIPDIAIFH